MQKLIIVIVAILLVAVVVAVGCLLSVKTMTVRGPELFGDGQMHYVEFRGHIVGHISTWGHYVLLGTMQGNEMQCHLYKVGSKGVGDYTGPVDCFGRFRRPGRFVGWLDFRGHARPFCGAQTTGNLPPKCFGD